jgi:predicted lipoprotein with Yx(FWY)xxD motif
LEGGLVKRLGFVVVGVVLFGLGGMSVTEVASAANQRPAAASGTLVKLRTTSYGKVLVGPTGRSLYILTADGRKVSHCNSLCRSFWPPLMTHGKPRAGKGVDATKLSQTAKHQVTYHGKPLYYYAQDSSAGQTNGEGVHTFGGYWYLLDRKGKNVTTTASGGGGYTY